MASGLPVGVSVWLVPVTVTGPTLPTDVLLELPSVSDSDPPLQPAGIDDNAIDVMTPSTMVHVCEIPLSEPHELTLALALTIFVDVVLVPPATALPGTASTPAVTAASAGPKRMANP